MTPPLFTRKPLLVFFAHWAAWILIYLITYLPIAIQLPGINWKHISDNYLVLGSVNFFLFYLVAFFLLQKIGIDKREWIWLSIVCIALVVLFTYLKFRIGMYWSELAIKSINTPVFFKQRWLKATHEPMGLFSKGFRYFLHQHVFYTFTIVFIAIAYRSLIAWYLQEKNRAALENEKLKAELSFLQMQINPHFLFNALNNVYSLSVLENSKLTGNGILKLSELLRYMLYEKTDDNHRICLEKELQHINNYISLEKMRHHGDVHIRFSIEGEVMGKRIAPLMIFPFIENACKHGLLTDADKPVIIQLQVADQQLDFSLENHNNNYRKDKTGGIGLQNVKKRLQLIYGNNFSFEETLTQQRYKVKLQLPL